MNTRTHILVEYYAKDNFIIALNNYWLIDCDDESTQAMLILGPNPWCNEPMDEDNIEMLFESAKQGN